MAYPPALVSEQHPLEVHWVYGFSNTITNGVTDLRTEMHSHTVGYIAGTVVVLFDIWSHTQKILQGHVHQIQCIAATPDKRVLLSSDCGPEAALIMWDVISGKALKAISQERTAGLMAMDVSANGAYIGTLSSILTGPIQELSIWDTKLSNNRPLATMAIQSDDVQTCIRFNGGDHDELITNGKFRVFVWKHSKSTETGAEEHFLNCQEGVIRPYELKQNVGDFTLSLFPPATNTAMTATVEGDVVIWHQERNEEEDYASQEENQKKSTDARVMHALKLVRIHGTAITAFATIGRYIATGDEQGFLRFYDNRLGLVGWLEELNAGGLTSISFSALENRMDSAQLTIHVPPFVVGTKSAHMRLLHAGLFEEQPGTWLCKGEQVMKPMPGVVGTVAAHPSKSCFALVGYPSLLQIQDYTTKTVIKEREFPKILKITCLQYSPLGSLLAVGFSNGILKLLAADTLIDHQSFSYTRSPVIKVEFSKDGTYIATADNSCCVALLYCKLVKVVVDIKKTQSIVRDALPTLHVSLLAADEKWECVGKYRSHAKSIIGLMFSVGEGGVNRLFSMGQDCMMIEYDLNKSFVDTGLKLKGSWLLNTLTLPAAMTTSLISGELQVITSDEGFKVRIYDSERFHSIRTFLGPVFGTAIHKFWRIHDQTTSKDHLVYSTREEVIGLMTFPSEDETHIQCMGVVAHAGPIACMEVSFDSKYVITCGGQDSIVIVTRVNISAWDTYATLERQHVGDHLGVDDETLQNIQKCFFYSQIREKGEDTVEERNLDHSLGIDHLMECYNGLGVFFSKCDVDGILDEISRPLTRKKEERATRVDFNDFFQTYMAHKPVLEFDEITIQAAINELGADQATGKISMELLLNTLISEGEVFTKEELEECIKLCTEEDLNLESLPEEADGFWIFKNLLRIETTTAEKTTVFSA
ncbi:cilia- and flagella-associated protein 251 [Marchantia polymorpha subsp. ruderalis]|uniref:Cilia- and flagella-associated protein 251 n=2 Tax=Marchantia polymorpha TaxID=3197 RepID=A0AAF6BR14_MARPO|nr:hypothetical protein MARPO_0135s0051 [Marchantia polymorpha]BBN14448.1 hypothetical protein Mp_6g11820 [Marchantia polymorpha subsp. ruderalis]|eukprot:PTQ29773.1 hypothetical protein MARPO_0135s0051 [Marchantia polymorpha]